MRGRTVEVKCSCGETFTARVADRKRGWGKYCSKSCKAKTQEQRTGQYKSLLRDNYYREEYGGTPAYNRNGEYEGFYAGPFDNTEHQNSGD